MMKETGMGYEYKMKDLKNELINTNLGIKLLEQTMEKLEDVVKDLYNEMRRHSVRKVVIEEELKKYGELMKKEMSE